MTEMRITASSGRQFAPFAVAVAVVMIDANERSLLLGSEKRGVHTWEIPSGALEAEETILDAAAREIREELGPNVRWSPLGVAHAYTIRYDDAVERLVSVVYVASYQGGEVVPGDDMRGAQVRWVSTDELDRVPVAVPSAPWILERAVQLFREWRGGTIPDLQPHLD
jgi:8-oxo-dGTP diphosphatase